MIDEKEEAMEDGRNEEEYYVKRNCYGCSQKERSTKLVEGYWNQRHLWNAKFDQTTPPTAQEVYYWLISTDNGKSLFCNISSFWHSSSAAISLRLVLCQCLLLRNWVS